MLDKLQSDLKSALKNSEKDKLNALRNLISKIKSDEMSIYKRFDKTDADANNGLFKKPAVEFKAVFIKGSGRGRRSSSLHSSIDSDKSQRAASFASALESHYVQLIDGKQCLKDMSSAESQTSLSRSSRCNPADECTDNENHGYDYDEDFQRMGVLFEAFLGLAGKGLLQWHEGCKCLQPD